MRRFEKIRDELVEVATDSEFNLPVKGGERFASKVRKYMKMLGEIDFITCSLQTKGHTMAKCREDLNILIDSVRQNRTRRNSDLYQCNLGTTYIGSSARIVQNADFISGVIKI